MASKKVVAIALGVAGLGLVTYGFARARKPAKRRRLPKKVPPPTTKKGAVICPAELGFVPASTTTAEPGDFVALRLADHKGTFTEVVWAMILSIHGKGDDPSKLPGGSASTTMQVRLTGTVGTTSVHVPDTPRHGFDIGTKLVLEESCAWEVFHVNQKGMALCGLFGRQVAEGAIATGVDVLVAGEEVRVFLAPIKAGSMMIPGPGWDVANPVWTRIVDVSPTKNVLRVMLLEEPAPMPGMTLEEGNRLDINRDCVFDTRPGGSG